MMELLDHHGDDIGRGTGGLLGGMFEKVNKFPYLEAVLSIKTE